jgi:soluble lytic murein transglycosylase-like protein
MQQYAKCATVFLWRMTYFVECPNYGLNYGVVYLDGFLDVCYNNSIYLHKNALRFLP